MGVELRECEPEDYEDLAKIVNAIYPEYRTTADEMRYEDENLDRTKYTMKRYVAVEREPEEVLAYGVYSHDPTMFHPRKFWMSINVHPGWQWKGIGTQLYGRVFEDLRELGATKLWSGAREDIASGVSFLQKRGFHEKMRAWESWLDLPSFSFDRFSGYSERVASRGTTFTTLREASEQDPDCYRKLYELHSSVMRDVPGPDTRTHLSFEDFLKYDARHPNCLPDGYFLAKDGERYIGLSALGRSQEEPKDAYQWLTGVHRDYRRKGFAMALKLKVIEFAKDRGYHVIKTWNDSLNRGMLAVNEKLGFKRRVGWITFEKKVRE
ncbi:MAG: GNAT family N-acetyltransferase [Candidatus Geothermarchaeales archaeon]